MHAGSGRVPAPLLIVHLQVGLCYSSSDSLMLSPLEILNRQALLLNSVAIPRVPCLSQRPWSRDFVFAGCVWAAGAGVGGGNALLAGAGSEQSPLTFVVPLSSPTTFF